MAEPDNAHQPTAQKASEGPSIPQSQATPLLTSFTTFLTLAIHSLLYHRQLYPSRTFITARAYNLPVQQSRHAGVCRWVNDAVAAVAGQLAQARVERVVFVVHAPKGFEVLERWVFDVGTFPEWGESAAGEDWAAGAEEDGEVNWIDVNEGLRGGLRRVAYAAEKMEKPPQGSTFTVAVELRDDAAAPIAHPQDWIPSQPESRPASKKKPAKEAPAKSTVPVRAVRAGPLFFECWVEHPRDKPVSQEPSNDVKPPPKEPQVARGEAPAMGPPDRPSKQSTSEPSSKESGSTNASS